jgi:hypothetical protein
MKKSKKWGGRERSVSSTTVLDTFQEKDRVRLLVDLNGIPSGTEGKIVCGITNE